MYLQQEETFSLTFASLFKVSALQLLEIVFGFPCVLVGIHILIQPFSSRQKTKLFVKAVGNKQLDFDMRLGKSRKNCSSFRIFLSCVYFIVC